jgi:hypothetical protein
LVPALRAVTHGADDRPLANLTKLGRRRRVSTPSPAWRPAQIYCGKRDPALVAI